MAEFSVTKSAQELLADQMWKMLADIGVDPTFKDSEGYEMDADGVLLEVARIMIERIPTEKPEWEYGAQHSQGTNAHPSRKQAEEMVAWHAAGDHRKQLHARGKTALVRRRKAGPWVPVEQEGTEQ